MTALQPGSAANLPCIWRLYGPRVAQVAVFQPRKRAFQAGRLEKDLGRPVAPLLQR